MGGRFVQAAPSGRTFARQAGPQASSEVAMGWFLLWPSAWRLSGWPGLNEGRYPSAVLPRRCFSRFGCVACPNLRPPRC